MIDLCGGTHCITPEILFDGALFEHAQRCASCWGRLIALLDERAAELPEIPGLMTPLADLLAMTEDEDDIASDDPISFLPSYAGAEPEVCHLLGKLSDSDEWSDALRDLAMDVDVSMLAESSLARRGLHLAHRLGGSTLTTGLCVDFGVATVFTKPENVPAAGEIRWIARPAGRFKATPPQEPAADDYQVPAVFFDEEFWSCAVRRLLACAQSLLSALRADEMDAEDYVQQAVTLVLERTRRYRDDVTPQRFLLDVLKSLISHDRKKRTRNAVIDVEVVDTSPLCEQKVIADDLKRQLLEQLPPDLQAYVRLRIAETCFRAKDYADALGVSVAEVRNMERRLRHHRKLWSRGLPVRKPPQEN